MAKRGPPPKRFLYNGKRHTVIELAEMAGISRNALWARINFYGYSVARAVETERSLRGKPPGQFTFANRKLSIREWSAIVGVPDATLNWRLACGWTIEQALSTPTPRQRRAGVVSNFVPSEGTGAGRTAQETPQITFSQKVENL